MEPESLSTMQQNSFVKIADGVYAQLTQPSAGGPASTVTISQSGTNNAVQTLLATAARVNATVANGKVTAPAAGAAIATTASLAIGTWDIDVTMFIGGTTVASLEIDNARLQVGAGAFGTLINPVAGTSGATANSKHSFRIQLASASVVSVNAIAAATAGAVYAATIVATRVM